MKSRALGGFWRWTPSWYLPSFEYKDLSYKRPDFPSQSYGEWDKVDRPVIVQISYEWSDEEDFKMVPKKYNFNYNSYVVKDSDSDNERERRRKHFWTRSWKWAWSDTQDHLKCKSGENDVKYASFFQWICK